VLPALRVSLFFAAVLITSTGSGQPSAPSEKKEPPKLDLRPNYTAFPDLKPHAPTKKDDILLPMLPELPIDAPLLRKVQREQAREGFTYLGRITSVIRDERWNQQYLHDTLFMMSAVYRVAAELEDKLANRIPWYEERVRKLKELEVFIETRVQNGTAPPFHLLLVRFTRLSAEADLLRLQAEVAKTGIRSELTITMKKSDVVFDPKKTPPSYTAFPDLKPPTYEKKTTKNSDGMIVVVEEEKGVVPLPGLPILPKDEPSLQTVHHKQVLEGLVYQKRLAGPRILVCFTDRTGLLYSTIAGVADTYQTAASLEERLGDRIAWYESRVRELKRVERFIEARVTLGTTPPHDLDMLRFYRLQTEADLLRLKDEVEKAGPTTAPAPQREEFTFEEPKDRHKSLQPHYTAFPDLKPSTIEWSKVKDDQGITRQVRRETNIVPRPPLPAVGADDPHLRKVLFEQLQTGLDYLNHLSEIRERGEWNAAYFREYAHIAMDVYRVAAKLETTQAKRVAWYEARIRTLKNIERYIDIRVGLGTSPPEMLNNIRVERLRAEAELLSLKAEPEPVTLKTEAPLVIVYPPGCFYPPPCERPRARLLPRLFRR